MWPKQSQAIITHAISLLFLTLLVQYNDAIHYESMCQRRSEDAHNCRDKERVTWNEMAMCMSKYQFRRMFRMTRQCFDELCQTIICSVGEIQFKS